VRLYKLRSRLKPIGGSMADDWNNIIGNQTIQTLWLKNADAEDIRRLRHAAVEDFPAIELNNSSSGFYIGYNYSYGSPSQFGTNLVTKCTAQHRGFGSSGEATRPRNVNPNPPPPTISEIFRNERSILE
jgi:hypothetical protein